MREPSTNASALAWYWQALNDKALHLALEIDYSEPCCGWFETRLKSGGPFVPARIWLEQEVCENTGELLSDEVFLCEINGQSFDPVDGWERIAANPITQARFNFMVLNAEWAKDYAPHEPVANPFQKTNWANVPAPQFT
jgi:hypothetical protein